MANIPLIHATTKVDYSGSGAVPSNAELIAADWNQTHATLSAGSGLIITTDGGTPPTLTFTVTSAGTNPFTVGTLNLTEVNPIPDDPLHSGTGTLPDAFRLQTTVTSTGTALEIIPKGYPATSHDISTAEIRLHRTDVVSDPTQWGYWQMKAVRPGPGDNPLTNAPEFEFDFHFSATGEGFLVPFHWNYQDGRIWSIETDSTIKWAIQNLTSVGASLGFYGASGKTLDASPEIQFLVTDPTEGTRAGVIRFGTSTTQQIDLFTEGNGTQSLQMRAVSPNTRTRFRIMPNGLVGTGAINVNLDVFENDYSGGAFRAFRISALQGTEFDLGTVYSGFSVIPIKFLQNGNTIWTVDISNNFIVSQPFSGTMISAGSGFQTNSISPAINLGSINAILQVGGTNLLKFDGSTVFTAGVDGTVNFGTTTLRFSNAYFGGLISAGGGLQTNATSTLATLNPAVDALYDFGTSTLRWRNATHSGSTSSGTFITNSTFQFGSLVQGALVSYDLTLGLSGSFAVKNTSSVLLFRADNSTGNFISAFAVSAATGFQTNAATSLNAGSSSLVFRAGSQTFVWDGTQIYPTTDTARNLGATGNRWNNSFFSGTTSTGTLQIGTGLVTAFNNRATAVNGVLAIVAEGDQTGVSGANASLTSFTVGATNGVFKVGGDIDITAISGATVTLQVVYTDWSGNSRTLVIVSSTALGDSPANDKTIMAQNGTAITVSTTLAGGTATWNVAAWIGWVK